MTQCGAPIDFTMVLGSTIWRFYYYFPCEVHGEFTLESTNKELQTRVILSIESKEIDTRRLH